MMQRPAHILPVIIISQFAGTSLWFAGNAILPDIQKQLHTSTGNMTSIVQFGFIAGTLIFAILSIADRFSAPKVFFLSSCIAALANLGIIWFATDVTVLFTLRFITGFFLAGIYPVGMKLAADWYEKGLGKALGFLVGALVLGTAFPHFLKSGFYTLPWKDVLIFTSIFAFIGGLLVLLFVKDGPYKKKGAGFHPSVLFKIFRSADFRSAAFGYFGHMWELYAFWAFIPAILAGYAAQHQYEIDVPLWSFIMIGIGGLSCVAGGYISQKIGNSRVAFAALLCSGICCCLSVFFNQMPFLLFFIVMIIWGITVPADSPQFSALVAQTAIPEYKGTALTIVTSIGFAITIGSIQFVNYLFNNLADKDKVFLFLAPGPLFGLIFLYRLVKQKK